MPYELTGFNIFASQGDQKAIMRQASMSVINRDIDSVILTELAKRTLNLPARIGRPSHLQGLIEDIHKPSYATSVGLLMYGHRRQNAAPSGSSFSFSLSSVFGSFSQFKLTSLTKGVTNLVKSLLP